MRKALLALLIALATPALAATPTPTPAGTVGECAPGLGIGLLEVPRATLKDPRARNYVIDSVKPGTTFTRKFQVCNGTSKALPVQVYPDSAEIKDGGFVLAPGQGKNELTTWMSVDKTSLTVPSGKADVLSLTISVPDDASSGERYAGVVAEAPPVEGQGGVAVGGRVGIRVYLDVSGGGVPKSDFTIDSLQAVRRADGTPAVLAKVHNTGARALDMRGSMQLSDGPAGLSAGPFPAQLGTTLGPGQTAPVVVPLDKAISGGPWHAVITMQSGLLERKAEGDVTFPDQAGEEAPPVKAVPLYKDQDKVATLAFVLIGLILLILIALFARAFLKKRRVGSQP